MSESNARFKARNIHIVRRAALHIMFPDCPLCGMPNTGKPFVKTLSEGVTINFDETDAAIDYCHLNPRDKGGMNNDNNLFVGHHRCNIKQGRDTIEVHCAEMRTAKSAYEIRTLTAQAVSMSDAILNGSLFYPKVMAKALEMHRAGHTHRNEGFIKSLAA